MADEKEPKIEFLPEVKSLSVAFKQTDQGKIDYAETAGRFLAFQPLFFDRAGIWWLWDKERLCWRITDETDVMRAFGRAFSFDTLPATTRNIILEALRRESRDREPKQPAKSWVQVGRTVIDVMTGEKREPKPEFFLCNPTPWDLGESDQTPVMDRLMADWVGADKVEALKERIAYCLLPDYPLHRCFAFIGAGLNGKDCLFKLIENLVGEENTCATTLSDLIFSRFAMSALFKKLVCFASETQLRDFSATERFKQVTGSSPVSVEFKHKNPFTARSYAKVFIASNSLPRTQDRTVGFYRRWDVWDCRKQFTERRDVLAEIPEQEYRNLAKKCVALLQKIVKEREFLHEGSIEDRTRRYEELSNPVMLFLREFCEKDGDGIIPFSEFYQRICDFLEERGYRKMSNNEVGRVLNSEGIEKKRKDSSHCILGWRFKVEKMTDITDITDSHTLQNTEQNTEESIENGNFGNIGTPASGLLCPFCNLRESSVFVPSDGKFRRACKPCAREEYKRQGITPSDEREDNKEK